MFLFNAKVWEKMMRYDLVCDGKTSCTIDFEVSGSAVEPKVFIYYEIKYSRFSKGGSTRATENSSAQRVKHSYSETSWQRVRFQLASQ